jgi:hypothetical protein
VGLSDNPNTTTAIRWGLAAMTQSVMKGVAQPSLPDRAAMGALLG